MNIRPMNGRLIVQVEKIEEFKKGNLLLLNADKDAQPIAQVVAIGADNDELGVSVGDKVLMGRYTGHPITHEEEDYIIIRGEDILAVIG